MNSQNQVSSIFERIKGETEAPSRSKVGFDNISDHMQDVTKLQHRNSFDKSDITSRYDPFENGDNFMVIH